MAVLKEQLDERKMKDGGVNRRRMFDRVAAGFATPPGRAICRRAS